MAKLGFLYQQGYGVTQDYAKAREWYEKAAKKGSALAMTALGVLYRDGKGVSPDFVKTQEWFEKARAAGTK